MSRVTLSIAGTDVLAAFADAGHQFIIEDIRGRDPVESDVQSVERPGSDGDRLIGSNLPARTVVVSYALMSEDADARRDAGRLLGRLMGSGLQRVEFSDQDGGHYRADVRNAEGDQWPRFGRGELIFYCPQPFLYGSERTTEPDEFDGTLSVETNHHVEPVIVWEVSRDVGAAWIEVDGQRLTVDTAISRGQQIRIDAARKEVRVGGVLNVENIHGTFPRVRDGSTVVTSPPIFDGDPPDEYGGIEFTYQERWV